MKCRFITTSGNWRGRFTCHFLQRHGSVFTTSRRCNVVIFGKLPVVIFGHVVFSLHPFVFLQRCISLARCDFQKTQRAQKSQQYGFLKSQRCVWTLWFLHVLDVVIFGTLWFFETMSFFTTSLVFCKHTLWKGGGRGKITTLQKSQREFLQRCRKA